MFWHVMILSTMFMFSSPTWWSDLGAVLAQARAGDSAGAIQPPNKPVALGPAPGTPTATSTAFMGKTPSQRTDVFSPDRAAFTVRFGDLTIPYQVMGAFVLPGEQVQIEADRADAVARNFELRAAGGELATEGPNRWTWTAPGAPGLSSITVLDPSSAESVQLNVFVMVPTGEVPSGYRIGSYPAPPHRHSESYVAPRGFIEVTPELESVLIAPHFHLGQFVCKQQIGYPKFLTLREPLLVKLELLLEEANHQGLHAESFSVMSGYRTPYYNRAIGNVTTFSRHQYGDAADIFIDEQPKDGVMDDLNHDGRSDVADARLLQGLVEHTASRPEFQPLIGGLGLYGPTSAHGPFVHVDVRGFKARWES